ncbi:hypothetical protein [Streptomyces ipomoeae]|uniref:hypothetical protein n=1 Tax=Streptomyces ipomoeae TaxID=103232 RepID=UPI0011465528|nr:hypothetical protein [Streptomyces ipomoeae]TQE35444.1 hypothetical protein Sipo7851_14375 [Streptomyces ipomoeae]
MTASSHHRFGHPMPGPMPQPVPLQHAPVTQAPLAPVPPVANPDVPADLVVDRDEPWLPMCIDCGNRRGPLAPRGDERYRSGAQVLVCASGCEAAPVRAATGVIAAAMEHGAITPAAIAQAEQDAGILFDPKRAEEIASAARAQALAEVDAELRQAREAVATLHWFHERWRAVQRLTYGRPGTDLMLVSEILAATDPDRTAGAPHVLTWDGLVLGPSGDTEGENTLVPCTTEYGAQAVLVLNDERRLQLGERLLTVHPAEACYTPGCGTHADDLDDSDPSVWGWIRIDVAGTKQGARWWCGPWCANAAITAAAAELAAADQAAAVNPHAQAPEPPFSGDPLAYGPTGIRCGCGKDAHSNLVPCQPDTSDDRAWQAYQAGITTSPYPQSGTADGRRYFVGGEPGADGTGEQIPGGGR